MFASLSKHIISTEQHFRKLRHAVVRIRLLFISS